LIYNNGKYLSIALYICRINQTFSHPTHVKKFNQIDIIYHSSKSIKLRLSAVLQVHVPFPKLPTKPERNFEACSCDEQINPGASRKES